MGILKLKKESYKIILERYFLFQNETTSLEPLTEILKSFRVENFGVILGYLESHKQVAENFGYYVINIFKDKSFNLSLTEANILSENAFFPELRKRILDTFLPAVENENTVWAVMDNVSLRMVTNFKYFREVSQEDLYRFFDLLGISYFSGKASVKRDILFSLNILAWRVIGNAMEVEVVRMVPEYRKFDNPFLALQEELNHINEAFRKNENFQIHSKNENYIQIKIYLSHCQEFVNTAFKNSSLYGISGKINQSLIKIRQQLQRIKDILPLLVADGKEDISRNSQVLFLNILEYKSHKNNLREFADESTRLLSHLITNHTAETGSHYITSSAKDYVKMFWKASFGGVIVGFLCIFKMLYSYAEGSEFSHAFLYSFNYAMGFIMIYLMGYTLATKQPAMTAATMAKVLSYGRNTSKNYTSFASVVSQLFRSQFISFVGNVLWAFPVALLVIYGLDVLLNSNLATQEADYLLMQLDPFRSRAVFHACIAGFFLFLSGIIAGFAGNSTVYYKIPLRIAKNPFFNQLIGEKRSEALAGYYARNYPGIISNLWFGIFMGSTGPIGKFLGLDIDIRHITFASGNFALGLYGKGFNIPVDLFIICLATVFIIGFFNFIVSFGLSIVLALRSRKIDFSEFVLILREIVKHFFSHPLHFFVPIPSELDDKAAKMIDETVSKK
ncbi:MAG: recombinase [Bergeyella sp.]|nr:recombinase [Bergeyella sp.]